MLLFHAVYTRALGWWGSAVLIEYLPNDCPWSVFGGRVVEWSSFLPGVFILEQNTFLISSICEIETGFLKCVFKIEFRSSSSPPSSSSSLVSPLFHHDPQGGSFCPPLLQLLLLLLDLHLVDSHYLLGDRCCSCSVSGGLSRLS